MRRPASRAALVAALAALAAATVACSQATEPGTTVLTVHAAASLRAPFEQLAQEFEAAHDGVEVRLNVAGSADLVAQVTEGAPADVVATADTATMETLADADLVSEVTPFATNTLVIAVPPGNPAGVTGLADLTDDLDLVVCAAQVPCGAATAQVEEAAGLTFTPVSEEQSVTDVLGKVRAGEADAGLVYVTDVEAAEGDVAGVAFPEARDAVNTYPVAVATGSDHPALARAFTELVTSATGEQVLAEVGFGRP